MRRIRIVLFYALKKLNPHPTVILSKGLGGDASPPLSVLSLNLVFQTDKGRSSVLKKLWKCMCWDSNGSPRNRTNCLWRRLCPSPHKPKSVPFCASWPLTSEPHGLALHPLTASTFFLQPQSADTLQLALFFFHALVHFEIFSHFASSTCLLSD